MIVIQVQFPNMRNEKIRIKGSDVALFIVQITGKQGDFYLAFSPSLNVSGYGKSKEDAEKIFKVELEVFCEDLVSMSSQEREQFLASLGFKQERFKKKNFSKTYVDPEGKLNDFENPIIEQKELQIAG